MALVPFPNKSKSAAEDLEPDWDDHEPESDTEGAERYFEPLFELTRELDPTRPVGFVNVMLAPLG